MGGGRALRVAACAALAVGSLTAGGCGVPLLGPAELEVRNDDDSTMDIIRVVIVPSDEWNWEDDGDEDLWDEDDGDEEFDFWFSLVFSWGAEEVDERVHIAPGDGETFLMDDGTYDVLVRWRDGREEVETEVYVLGGFVDTVTFYR